MEQVKKTAEGLNAAEPSPIFPSPFLIGAFTPAEVDFPQDIKHEDATQGDEILKKVPEHVIDSAPHQMPHGLPPVEVQPDPDYGTPEGDEDIKPGPVNRRRQATTDTDVDASPIPQSSQTSPPGSPSGFRFTKPAIPKKAVKSRKVPNMLRELGAHNESPELEAEEIPFDLEDEANRVHLTRGACKGLTKLARNEMLSPQMSQNLKTLMNAQFQPERGTKKYYPDDSGDFNTHAAQQRRSESIDAPGSSQKQHGRTLKAREKSTDLPPFSMENSNFVQEAGARSAWQEWEHSKKRIVELLEAPGYVPRPQQQAIKGTKTGEKARKQPYYYPTKDVPEGFNGAFHMESGLFVFTPTAGVFSNFRYFLEVVEEIAGRERGVVKVVLPQDCMPSFSQNCSALVGASGEGQPDPDIFLETEAVKMTMDKVAESHTRPLFNIHKVPRESIVASDWLRLIQRNKDHIIKKRNINEQEFGDVWEESQARKPYTQERMINDSAYYDKTMVCASSIPAKPELRAALRCGDPHLKNYLGSRFVSSPSTQSGVNEPVFQISGIRGTMFGIQMGKYAAYTMNVHHNGAPRCWTVVRPKHHERLENLIYANICNAELDADMSKLSKKPPPCSQFVKHQPTYVPNNTLQLKKLEYADVQQNQGEMVIIFPYAYYQGYNTGPNITEEIMYASDRWEVFLREKLYQYCSRNCAAKAPDFFNLTFVNTSPSPGLRSGLRRRRALENLRAQDDAEVVVSSSKEQIIVKRHSTLVSGLRKMDCVEDDGGWDRSNEEDEGSADFSFRRRKSTRTQSSHKQTHQERSRSSDSKEDANVRPKSSPVRSTHKQAQESSGSDVEEDADDEATPQAARKGRSEKRKRGYLHSARSHSSSSSLSSPPADFYDDDDDDLGPSSKRIRSMRLSSLQLD